MERKLKVGDSFEVVEVLANELYNDIIGEHCVNLGLIEDESPLYNNVFVSIKNYKTSFGYVTLLLDSEIKPIGKLTITKLK